MQGIYIYVYVPMAALAFFCPLLGYFANLGGQKAGESMGSHCPKGDASEKSAGDTPLTLDDFPSELNLHG